MEATITTLFLASHPASMVRLVIDKELRAAWHRDALVFPSAWAAGADSLPRRLNLSQPHVKRNQKRDQGYREAHCAYACIYEHGRADLGEVWL